MQRFVQGAGGKSGGGGAESPDSLRSTQIADVVDLISEGECAGLTNGLKSIYLDGVPLQNPDGSYNFDAVTVAVALGTQGQPAISGADGVRNEVGVGVVVPKATPVVRTITNTAVDVCRVTIAVPQLTDTDTESGDLRGSSFEWAIDLQSAGGGFVEVMRETVSGKATSRYTKAKSFPLTGSAPWDVRVRRLSDDSASTYVVNEFVWATYTEVQSLKLRYPNSALVRSRVNAQAFSRIPVRSFDWCGILVQVPTNYDPITKAYTGVWDGTFKAAWTDSPPWIWYAVVTHPRWGLGRYFQVGPQLKWWLYSIAQYCDGLVPDGKGGQEPRFRCGVEIRTREQAYKVVTDLAAIFRAIGYWANNDVMVVQDAPADADMLYTPANVVGGRFEYATSSGSKRPTQVTVWFNDIDQQGKLVPEVVRDPEAEKRFGIRPMRDLSPLGVWSRGQAHRVGKWALYSEQYEGATVSFRVGLDGTLVQPGRLFQVADPHEAGERLGGRIHSATASAVTLDAPVTLAAGESYLLSVMLPDPADPARLVVQQRPVTTAAGSTGVLAVFPAFDQAPAAQTVWLLQSDAVEATWWRCLMVREVEDSNDFEVTALRHHPEKFALVDQGTTFEPAPVSRLQTVAAQPQNLALVATVYRSGGEARNRVTVGWEAPSRRLEFLVAWQLNGGPWTDLPPTTTNAVDLDNLADGLLRVQVKSRTAFGGVSLPVTEQVTLATSVVPAAVSDLRIERSFPGGIEIRWATSAAAGDRTEIRLNGAGWEDAVVLYSGNSDTMPFLWPADGVYTVRARRLSVWGDYSIDDAVLSFTVTGMVLSAYDTAWQHADGSATNWLRSIVDPESGEVLGTEEVPWVGGLPLDIGFPWARNFDARNDRIGTTPAAPTVATDGTAVDHVLKPDGSADVSFEWAWGGDEATIDGFEVLLFVGVSPGAYTVGSQPDREVTIVVPAFKRAMLWLGLNASSYLTLAVRTYRMVDPDVDADGIIRSAWVQPAGAGEAPYQPAANVSFSGNLTGTIGGIPASNAAVWDVAAANFNDRNDRLATTPAAPTVATDGTAVDHVDNTDASADVSFEWAWGGDEATIDGFEVLLYLATSSGAYTVGTNQAAEQLLVVPANKRAVLAYGINPTSWATWAVRAYRKVDPDVAAAGVLRSAWVQAAGPGENPYRPAANAAFAGDVTGTVGGVAASNASTWHVAATNFNSRNDRLATAPASPTIAADGTAVDHALRDDGSADVSFEWAWSGDESTIDGFEVLLRVRTTGGAYAFGTAPDSELLQVVPASKRAQIWNGLAATSYMTVGVRAFRVVDADVSAGGILRSSLVQPAISGEAPYQPAASLAFNGEVSGTVGGIPVGDVNVWSAITGIVVDSSQLAPGAANEVFDVAYDAAGVVHSNIV